ncbi:unnamed protein product, partial [Coccothraustes coccothraustes]
MNLFAQLGPQAVTGAVTTAGFFLCEGLLRQHFNIVPNGVAEPQPGDLFLFPLASGGPGWWGAHAGIYCGDGEIIHLEGSSGMSPSGVVAKHGKSHLLRTRGRARVLRRKGALDAAALQRRVRAAMEQPVEYDTVSCNCIHFALALLGLGHLAGAMILVILDGYVRGRELGGCHSITAVSPALLSEVPRVPLPNLRRCGAAGTPLGQPGSPCAAVPDVGGGRCSRAAPGQGLGPGPSPPAL